MPAEPALPAPRVVSVDAYRGFAMLLLMLEGLRLWKLTEHFKGSQTWAAIAFNTTHVEWGGCSLHDLIQPSFSFLVGVALVLSLAKRTAMAEPFWKSALHALLRSAFLILWGIGLRSIGGDHLRTYFTFEDTLTQIGLGYFPLFLITRLKPIWHWLAFGILVVGYWGAFALFPAPGPEFDYAAVGVPADWPHHRTGLAEHWNKNSNLAWKFDTWFLNLFHPEKDFHFNRGGYATLSFVPTLATMLLGTIAGGWLKSARGQWEKVLLFIVAGAIGLAAGRLLDNFGICPCVKRIWTPSWVLFSGGWCFLILALFHACSDAIGFGGWSYPLRVIGANSILIYTVVELPIGSFLVTQALKHLPEGLLDNLDKQWHDVAKGSFLVVIYWLGLWWLYAKRVFVKV